VLLSWFHKPRDSIIFTINIQGFEKTGKIGDFIKNPTDKSVNSLILLVFQRITTLEAILLSNHTLESGIFQRIISFGSSILWNSLPGDMHFDGIESWGFSFLGIRPHRILSLYNLIPHLMDFDGIVSLGDSQFHGCLSLGIMDFMEFVPTDQSFYTI
jgi:hypothetical protein